MSTQLSVLSACRLTQIEKMATNAIRVAKISSAATMRGWSEVSSPVEPLAAMVLRPYRQGSRLSVTAVSNRQVHAG